MEAGRRLNDRAAAPVTLRSHEQVTGLFTGLELIPPGVVAVQQWRPATDLEAGRASVMWAGIARKN